ncbi:MAG TPA: EAL domain-containing protein [Candidatus Limnocylindrales bacterium]
MIRSRLILTLLVEFGVLMAAAALGGLWPGGGIGRERALWVLTVAAIGVPLAVGFLARGLLDKIDEMENERERLLELYGRARTDALLDALTGLGNHRAFQEELARQLELARRHNSALALLLIDVDDLKKVNDERGHAVGDELLAAVGKVASAALRRSDRAFRVGGDEFAVLLPEADIDSALAVARRILGRALGSEPGRTVDPFSLSIGVSAYPSPAFEANLLYRQADAALYWCKRHGRTAAVAYDPGRHGSGIDTRSIGELSAAVSQVLSASALSPVYQPIFSLETGRPIGYEGLVRPVAGASFLEASSLFAAAEAADRTVELDLACIEAVAKGAGPLEPDTYLSVNVSPRTLESDLFHPTEIVAILRRRKIEPRQVVIELTEREAVEDIAQLRKNVAACQAAGFRLAADDVGAGNAGLRLLSEVHFDMVKIDLSLVQGGVLHDPSHAILRALQDVAARWRAAVVAEGVETPQQLVVIRELGIPAAQGYLLGRPGPERHAEPIDVESLTTAKQGLDLNLFSVA